MMPEMHEHVELRARARGPALHRTRRGHFFGSFVRPLYERIVQGGTWHPHVRRFTNVLTSSSDRQRDVQRNALRSMLLHAVTTVPYYRYALRERGVDASNGDPERVLASFPRLRKADVRHHIEALISTSFPRRVIVRAATGGTTSTPTPFFQNLEAIRDKNASAEAMRRLMGWGLGDRVAYLWGAAQDLPKGARSLLRRIKQFVLNRLILRTIYLPAGIMDDELIAKYVKRLKRFRPEVLQAYPSAADLMARWLIARGERVKIPLVILTAEPTYEDQRLRIRRAFGGDVTTFYGSREVGWVAAECRTHGQLHINTPTVYLETAADGNLLITDLCNRAMPLIRYEVGDWGRVSDEPCPCGDARPVLTSLEGRSTDAFIMPSGRRVLGVLLDVRGLHHDAGGIVDAQIVQEELGAIDLYYVPGTDFKPVDLNNFVDHIDDACGGEVVIRTHAVDQLQPEPNGKMRYCICRLDTEIAPETPSP